MKSVDMYHRGDVPIPCKLLGTLAPLIPDHMIREERYYLANIEHLEKVTRQASKLIGDFSKSGGNRELTYLITRHEATLIRGCCQVHGKTAVHVLQID